MFIAASSPFAAFLIIQRPTYLDCLASRLEPSIVMLLLDRPIYVPGVGYPLPPKDLTIACFNPPGPVRIGVTPCAFIPLSLKMILWIAADNIKYEAG